MKTVEPNLTIRSNLWPEEIVDEKNRYKYLPGDLLCEVYPEYKDVRNRKYLTPRQLEEYQKYLPCLLCGRACQGSCQD